MINIHIRVCVLYIRYLYSVQFHPKPLSHWALNSSIVRYETHFQYELIWTGVSTNRNLPCLSLSLFFVGFHPKKKFTASPQGIGLTGLLKQGEELMQVGLAIFLFAPVVVGKEKPDMKLERNSFHQQPLVKALSFYYNLFHDCNMLL